MYTSILHCSQHGVIYIYIYSLYIYWPVQHSASYILASIFHCSSRELAIYRPVLSTVPSMELDIYQSVLSTVPSIGLDIYLPLISTVPSMELAIYWPVLSTVPRMEVAIYWPAFSTVPSMDLVDYNGQYCPLFPAWS